MTADNKMVFWGTFLVAIFCVSAMPLDDRSDRVRREVAATLMRQTFDFSTTCPGGIIIKLGDKQINAQDLRLSQSEAEAIAPVLYDQSFQDQVDVWCKVAKLTQELAASIGRSVNTFDVETLQLYQGDIVLTKNTVDAAVDYDPNPRRKQRTLRPTESNPDFALLGKPRSKEHSIVKRKVISDKKYFWTDAKVPWYIDPSYPFTDADKLSIREGIDHWAQQTCITFPEIPGRRTFPHLRFIKARGCYSYIGKDPKGQPVSIGNGCTRLGIVAHEIGHALGLSHEQSRPDRNRYVRINFSNVWAGFEANFFANGWEFFDTEDIPYDYSSVMHYAARDFARDSSRDTVESVDPAMRETMGQREGLSFWDLRLANTWYCSDRCGDDSLEWDICAHDGYRNPKKCRECLCPPGWAPPFCEEPVQSDVCGSTGLSADGQVKTFISPGYNGAGIPANTDCHIRLTAPTNMRLRLKFVNDFGLVDITPFARAPACGSYVEVRYKNMALTGPRFCGKDTPRGDFVSHGPEALLSFSNKRNNNTGFMLEYSAETCGGCSPESEDSEPACLKTELYDCDDTSTKDVKQNQCFDVAADNKLYCCPGFTLSGDDCQRDTPIQPLIVTTTGAPPTTPTTTAAPTTTSTTSAAPTTTPTTTATPTTAPTTTAALTTTPTTTAATTTTPTTTAATTTTPTTTATPTTTPTTTAAPVPDETTTTEAPVTEPTADEWEEWSPCRGVCGFCGRQGRQTICKKKICSFKVQVRACVLKDCPLPQPSCFQSLSEFNIPLEGPKTRRINI